MAGTLFADFRNAGDFSDWNTIIYGHNMKNDSMFGTLTDYKAQAHFDEHPVMYLLTPEQNYKINLSVGFVTQAGSELYDGLNPDEAEKAAFVEDWLKRSDFRSEAELSSGQNLITLSTCSYENSNARYVIVGVLEKL